MGMNLVASFAKVLLRSASRLRYSLPSTMVQPIHRVNVEALAAGSVPGTETAVPRSVIRWISFAHVAVLIADKIATFRYRKQILGRQTHGLACHGQIVHYVIGAGDGAHNQETAAVWRHRLHAAYLPQSRCIQQPKSIVPKRRQRQAHEVSQSPCFSRSINVCIICARSG